MTPDVLIVGHIAKDKTDDGWRAGGSVLYAARQCSMLGLDAAVVTRWGEAIDPATLAPGVSWHVLPDATSTTFENHYAGDVRHQRLLDRAAPIGFDDVPEDWRSAPIVLLMPVFHDVDPGIVACFAGSGSFIALSVQGWLRELDITDVHPSVELPSGRSWQGAGVVFVSEEDVADPEAVEAWTAYVPTVVLTRGRRGSTIWSGGQRIDLPAIATNEVDPTGAGDVYATAFTVRYHETADAAEAGRFATAAAALSVRGIGFSAIGDRRAIEGLLSREAVARA